MLTQLLCGKSFFKNVFKDCICVFLYHEVSTHPSEFNSRNNLNVPPVLFEQQIKLIRNIFNIISPVQLMTGDFETPAALITFDDGMPGYFENAVPILERYECPSVIFMNMGPVNGEVFWAGVVSYLLHYDIGFVNQLKDTNKRAGSSDSFTNWREEIVTLYVNKIDSDRIYRAVRAFCGPFATRGHLNRVAGSEWVYLGNHLYNHYNASTLAGSELQIAYLRNKDELDKYPNSLELFSYPYGQVGSCYNEETNAVIIGLGARKIFSANALVNYEKESVLMHRIPGDKRWSTESDLRYAIVLAGLRRYKVRNWCV